MTAFFDTDWEELILIPTIGLGVVAECTCESCQEKVYGLWISWGVWTAGLAIT